MAAASPRRGESTGEGGGTDHLCGVLTHGTAICDMPGAGMPGGITQFWAAVGEFHVPTLLVEGEGGSGRGRAADPL